jgi:protein-disulfide isomerase
MSRKSNRNRPSPEAQTAAGQEAAAAHGSRRSLVLGIVIALLAIVGASYLFSSKSTQPSGADGSARATALASQQSPTLGEAAAKVHIVEFLDPACETCAAFYPLVKQVLAQNPGKIRLSVRHVALHEGSDYVVRLLEASRLQDQYWETLETLLATQSLWTEHHQVYPDRALQTVGNLGLDLERLQADMNSAEVVERAQRDRADAMTLKVTATPEYFVNGRQMPSFGEQQLMTLIGEELRKAYP